jgi:hypothetical protein
MRIPIQKPCNGIHLLLDAGRVEMVRTQKFEEMRSDAIETSVTPCFQYTEKKEPCSWLDKFESKFKTLKHSTHLLDGLPRPLQGR